MVIFSIYTTSVGMLDGYPLTAAIVDINAKSVVNVNKRLAIGLFRKSVGPF